MTESQILMACTSLSKRYAGVTAVADVSLQVRAGEVMALVGPNGAGKTTLIDLITGQQEATSGEVWMEGKRLTGPPSRRTRSGRFSRTFQHPLLREDLTVRENIRVGAVADRFATPWRAVRSTVAGIIRVTDSGVEREIADVARELGLVDLDRLAGDLPLGERRLAEVARALVRRPTVLLLDEPFAGSDAAGLEGMRSAIASLTARGCGVLVVDHNVDIIASIADRVVLMERGRVVFDGSPEDCLASDQMQRVYFGEVGV